jgi:hypothetical protein
MEQVESVRPTDRTRVYFNDSKDPYSVWLAGARIYICPDPDDVAGLYRNTTTISFHSVIEDMYRWIGTSKDGFDKLFTLDENARHNIGMARPLTPALMVNEYHRHLMKPGEPLDDLVHNRTIPRIKETLDSIANHDNPAIVSKSSDGPTVSLLELCGELFLRGTTTSFLGEKIWDVNPKLLDSFAMWERTSWKYMFQTPDILSRDMLNARDDIVKTFVMYLNIPREERSDSHDFVKAVETMGRDIGCSKQDMARVFMLHFWA